MTADNQAVLAEVNAVLQQCQLDSDGWWAAATMIEKTIWPVELRAVFTAMLHEKFANADAELMPAPDLEAP